MRIDEVVSLQSVLKANQYLKLLRRLSTKSAKNINVARIKNKIIKSWRRGKKSKKYFDSLLAEIDTNVDTLLQEED
jgi:argonaute-like protein implicated in RNA metabolism and viral defense